jgi:FKBP-type peptidyl-prolyl cis-trans isomerase FklB
MKVTKILVVLIMAVAIVSCNNQPKKVTALESEIDTVSYALGLNMAAQINKNFKEIDKDIYVQAILDALDSADLLVSLQESQPTVQAYFAKKQEATQLERFGANKKAGEDFLAENKSKEGVMTTASGLQYKVIKAGKGAKPKATDKVRIHYHGTTIDGKVFDSSVDRKTPYELGVNQFVTGFSEGLQLMKVGAKYQFFIPQELAYKERSTGPIIKPFSALVFEVELLDILSK